MIKRLRAFADRHEMGLWLGVHNIAIATVAVLTYQRTSSKLETEVFILFGIIGQLIGAVFALFRNTDKARERETRLTIRVAVLENVVLRMASVTAGQSAKKSVERMPS